MAKMTPDDWKKEGEEFKKFLAAAKKKPQRFGLVELTEGMCLNTHPTFSSKKLLDEAKKKDGAKKSNSIRGSVTAGSNELIFECVDPELPPGFQLKFSQYMKKVGFGSWSAQFNFGKAEEGEETADGAAAPEAVGDGDGKSAKPGDVGAKPKPGDGKAAAGEAKKPEGPSKEALTKDLKYISDIFKLSFPNMSATDANQIKAALKSIAAAIAGDDLTGAQNLMNKLTLLTGVSSASPLKPIVWSSGPAKKDAKPDAKAAAPDANAKRKQALKQAFDALKPSLRDALAKAEGGDKAEFGKLVKDFDAAFKADDVKGSETALKALKQKLEDSKGLLDKIADVAGKVKEKLDEAAKEAEDEAKKFVKDVAEGVEGVVEDIAHGVGDALGILSEEDKKRQKELATLKVPDGRQMALIQLARDNPKTYDSAVKALKSLEKTHPGVDVSPTGVNNAIKAIADAETAKDNARKDWQASNKAVGEKEKELAEKQKAEAEEQKKVQVAQKALADFKAGLPKDLKKLSEAERKKLADEGAKLTGALEDAKKLLKAASDATKSAQTAVDAAKADRSAKATTFWEKDADLVNARADETKLQEKKSLLDALSFGPLSAKAAKPMDDASVAKFVDAFAKDPKIAASAVKLAGQVDDPKLIAENVGMICDKVADGFADKDGKKLAATTEELQAMAETALKNGARMGPDYFKGFEEYLKSGKQLKPDDCEPTDLKPGSAEYKKKIALNRSGKMADALMDANGKVDPDSPAAKEAMEHMMFHPGSLKTPAPAMTDQMSKLMDDFRDKKKGPQMQAVLDGIKDPTMCRASHSLVSATIGKDSPDVDAKDIRKAVMSAMLTPLAQGPVGSCFSTGPARAVREQDPVLAMKGMTEIATKGVFTPAKGDAIPAVMGLPKGENPLMRSYEYSIATAGAELENSRENQNLRGGLFNNKAGETSLAGLEAIVGSEKWKKEIEGKVQEAIEDGLVFQYNAGPKVGDGSGDGSSTHGRFEILDASTRKPILSEKEFQAVIGRLALDACGFDKASDEGKKVLELVNKKAFLDTVMKAYNKDGAGTKYAPWNMQGGGFARTSTEALQGGDPKEKAFMGQGDGKPENEGARTKAVLEAFLKGTQGQTADMVSLSTNGRKDEGANHAFNGLPNHPSVDKIRPPDSDKKIEEQLLKPGAEMAKTKLPPEQAAAIYDEMVKDIISSYSNEEREAVSKELLGKRPTEEKTAGELKQHVNDLLDAFKKKQLADGLEAWEKSRKSALESDMKKWEEEQKKSLKVDKLPDDLVAKRREALQKAIDDAKPERSAQLEKGINSKINNQVDKQLMKNFKAPEVVVADTNWGGDDSQIFFVIAPDPSSGELKMWRKDKFSGEMTPAGDNWVNSTWFKLDGVPPVGS